MPACTHLQRAQVTSLARHLLAYFWMLERDRGRLAAAREAFLELPLGAGAAVGLDFDLDRAAIAADLGFDGVAEKSLDAIDRLDRLLSVVQGLLEGVTFDETRLAAACDPFLAAADVADYLVERGVPFREAHHLTGTLVRQCLDGGVALGDVGLDDLRALSPVFDEGYYEVREPAAQPARKRSRGGSAPARVREQLELAGAALAAHLCC